MTLSPFRRMILGLGLAALSAGAATAQEGRSAALLDLAGRLPPATLEGGLLSQGGSPQIVFADHAAVRDLSGRDDLTAYQRLRTPFLQYVLADFGASWPRLVGFAVNDVEASLDVALPPEHQRVVRLAPGAGEAVGPALLAAGYEAADDAYARGEDLASDLGARNPADPFGGALGMASRVAVDGDVVLQANAWPALALLQAQESPGPALGALGAAIDAPAWGEARLLQATLLTAQADFGLGAGLPPWRLAAFADLGSPGAEDVALALFAYDSRGAAEDAAARLEEGWPGLADLAIGRPFLEIVGGTWEVQVLGDTPAVAVLALRTPAEEAGRGFGVLQNAYFQRALPLFGLP